MKNLLIYLMITLSFCSSWFLAVLANRHSMGMHKGRGGAMKQYNKMFGSDTDHSINLLKAKRKSRRVDHNRNGALSSPLAGSRTMRPKYGINYQVQNNRQQPVVDLPSSSQLMDHRTQLLAFHNRQRVPNHTLGHARESQADRAKLPWMMKQQQNNKYKSEWEGDDEEFIELSHTGSSDRTADEEERARRNKAIAERMQEQQRNSMDKSKKVKTEEAAAAVIKKKPVPQAVEFDDIFKDFNLEIPGYNVRPLAPTPTVAATDKIQTEKKTTTTTNQQQQHHLNTLLTDDFDLDKFLSDDHQVSQFLDSTKHF